MLLKKLSFKISLIKYFLFAALLMLPMSHLAAMDGIKTDQRYLHVQSGQTLHNIVSKLYPKRVKEWPSIRKNIVRMNPHAFINGKETRMKADVRLKLPTFSAKRVVKKKTPAPRYVGDVIMTRGEALAVDLNRKSRRLKPGDKVYVGEKLITGANGFIRLNMIDEAKLDLRCYTIMVIEEYLLKPAARKSVLNLLQGSLKKVTGEIGKWTEDIYEMKTPVASVGVRGTEYALRVFQSKGCDGTVDTKDDGLYLKVIKGIVYVHNKRSRAKTEVVKGDTLYMKSADAEPIKNIPMEGVIIPAEIKPKVIEPEPVIDARLAWKSSACRDADGSAHRR